MKNIFTFMILLITQMSWSQTESIIHLKETDFTLYKTHKVKYQETGEIKRERQVICLENAETLIFLNNDSLALTAETGSSIYTRLADIQEVSKYKKRLSPVLGITLGAVGGGILGGVIGRAVSGSESRSTGNLYDPFVNAISDASAKTRGAIIGALIGVVGGGIIGAVITTAINHVTLDLFSVPEIEKKNKLIKFLRENR